MSKINWSHILITDRLEMAVMVVLLILIGVGTISQIMIIMWIGAVPAIIYLLWKSLLPFYYDRKIKEVQGCQMSKRNLIMRKPGRK